MHTKNIKIMNNLVNEMYCQGNIPNVVTLPEFLVLAVTTRCNYDCMMCKEWKKEKQDLSDKLMQEVHGMLPFLNRMHITGGEPLMHKGIWELIDAANANHVDVSIVTNGSLLNEKNIERLMDSGVKDIKFSLDAATQETYSKIRHANIYKVLGNIAKLTQAKLDRKSIFPIMELGFVVMRNNVHELTKAVVLAHELGCRSVRAAHAFTTGIEGLDEQSLRHEKERSDAEMLKASAVARKLGVVLNLPKLFNPGKESASKGTPGAGGASFREIKRCDEPWRTMFLMPDGHTRLCCQGAQGHFGNLEEMGFEALWNNPERQDVRTRINTDNPPPACAGCTVYPQMTAKMKSTENVG